MSDPLSATNPTPASGASSSSNGDLPATTATLSEVFLDDDFSKANYSTASMPTAAAKPPVPDRPPVSNTNTTTTSSSSQPALQTTTSLSNGGVEPVEEEKKILKTGKVISLVYPSNKHCSWLTPPYYTLEKMPKAFSSKELQVPHAVYREFMQCITADVRFRSYCVLFSRVVPLWVLISVVLLMFMLLASQDGGLHVMVFTVLWVIMMCVGLGFCVLIRKYLVHALHLVVRDANEISLKHNVLVGVQDRGQLSCHKVVIVLMYFNPSECTADIKRLIRVHKANQPHKVEMPKEEELEANARDILLANTQPYVKAYVKKQLLFPTKPSEGVSEFRPKHCASSICLCQFVEKKVFHNLPLLS